MEMGSGPSWSKGECENMDCVTDGSTGGGAAGGQESMEMNAAGVARGPELDMKGLAEG